MIGWLKTYKARCNDDEIVVRLDEVKQEYEVIDFSARGYLILHRDDIWLRFAILEFSSSYADDSNIEASIICQGEGIESLRECRHTWWGEKGYLYYPDGFVISEAFKELSKYFDKMVK